MAGIGIAAGVDVTDLGVGDWRQERAGLLEVFLLSRPFERDVAPRVWYLADGQRCRNIPRSSSVCEPWRLTGHAVFVSVQRVQSQPRPCDIDVNRRRCQGSRLRRGRPSTRLRVRRPG